MQQQFLVSDGEQLEKPKAKQEPTRVSIQLVRAASASPKPILPPSIEPISLLH